MSTRGTLCRRAQWAWRAMSTATLDAQGDGPAAHTCTTPSAGAGSTHALGAATPCEGGRAGAAAAPCARALSRIETVPRSRPATHRGKLVHIGGVRERVGARGGRPRGRRTAHLAISPSPAAATYLAARGGHEECKGEGGSATGPAGPTARTTSAPCASRRCRRESPHAPEASAPRLRSPLAQNNARRHTNPALMHVSSRRLRLSPAAL